MQDLPLHQTKPKCQAGERWGLNVIPANAHCRQLSGISSETKGFVRAFRHSGMFYKPE
jgi:hypothetical protein